MKIRSMLRGAAAAVIATSMAQAGGSALAQESTFSPEQRKEIEQIVTDLMIAKMSGKRKESEQLLDARDPKKIVAIAKRYGEATLAADPLGDPLIKGSVKIDERPKPVPYEIYFYGCKSGKDCKNLQFRSRWDFKGVTDKDSTRWNREKRFGKAFIDEDGNFTLEMNVNLDLGVTRGNMIDTFDWWRAVVKDFTVFFKL
ncbi:MAG: YbjN domain-containing protein [Neomegalonema sp.]|nr:YbjN domain-containing protein [Neomegalonema sp.]